MKELATLRTLNTVAGILALIAFGYFTHWAAAISLFFIIWSNNISEFMRKLNE